MTLIIGTIIVFGGIICFIIIHFRPLTEYEITVLGVKRRNAQIRYYFSFNNYEFIIDTEFKNRMKPNGSFYNINVKLFNFPSVSAALLKYKKHEWIIIGFEKSKLVQLIWVNKGFDRESVASYLSAETITETAKRINASTVLILHNHPNINPNQYDCSKPSKQDFISAKYFSDELNRNGINLIESICERGKHYEYYLSPSYAFLPIIRFIEAIKGLNNKSKWKNLSLHLERMF